MPPSPPPPHLPSIYLLPTHIQPEELHQLEETIPSLTHDVREAELVLGKISNRERALFELRRLKLMTEDVDDGGGEGGQRAKRLRIDDAGGWGAGAGQSGSAADGKGDGYRDGNENGLVRVLKLSWLMDSRDKDVVLPFGGYLLYQGRKLPPEQVPKANLRRTTSATQKRSTSSKSSSTGKAILSRAAADNHTFKPSSQPSPPFSKAPLPAPSSSTTTNPDISPSQTSTTSRAPPPLLHETTSEHDGTSSLPPVPEYLATVYSCERPTPANPPNADFMEELKQIRTLRLLRGDEVGVRAYSTSIASVAAYPFKLRRPQEVARLPGCGARIAELYQEWRDSGQTKETVAAAADEEMNCLKLFYEVWGVGDTTAREFYKKGWRDLDDVIEYGWASLSRVQQIGVKYHADFNLAIPRPEVEQIASKILHHARAAVDPGVQMVITGGYRRGKQSSGDVDVLLSHRDEGRTLNMVDKVVRRLEGEGLISHTLSLGMRNSERGQVALPSRGGGGGRGFDTLDKALVVWFDERAAEGGDGDGDANVSGGGVFDTEDKDEDEDEDEDKNSDTGNDTNTSNRDKSRHHRPHRPHRRVDIIVTPWKTAGCALLGWSGGTTFQRDLRRLCTKTHGFRFDSSGVRRRSDGTWVDLEGGAGVGPAPDMETAERRVFEGLGLVYREPWERCTG